MNKKHIIYILAAVLIVLAILMYKSCSKPAEVAPLTPTQSQITVEETVEELPPTDSTNQQLIDFYTNKIQTGHEDGLNYYKRGLVYLNMQQFRNAIQDFTRAINIMPESANAYFGRATAYEAEGMMTEAIADYTEAVKLKSDDPSVYNGRALLYVDQDKYDAALVDYQAAIALDPGYDRAYYNLGTLYERQKKYSEAKQQYDLAIANNNKQKISTTADTLEAAKERLLEAYYRRAFVQAQLADLNAAMADLNYIIAADPNYAKAYTLRSQIHAKQGNSAAAAEDQNIAETLGMEKLLDDK